MKLHSIYFVRAKGPDPAPPPQIALNLQSFKTQYPGGQHQLYGLDAAEAYLAQHFDAETLAAFRTLTPLSYKADLLRFCLLHHEGGLYSDVSLLHFAPLHLGSALRFACFRDMTNNSPLICSTSFLYSKPAEPVWAACIEQIKRNVAARYYGLHPLYPTGPMLFGQAVAAYFEGRAMLCGDTVSVNRRDPYATLVFSDPGGRPLALKHKSGDGLGQYGAPQESYNQLWHDRQVYGERPNWRSSGRSLLQRGLSRVRGAAR